LQNLFTPKGSLVNAPQKKKKRGKEKQKKRGGEKAKGKRRNGSETFSKSRNFAFCACPNFESCNLASGTKASPVLDL